MIPQTKNYTQSFLSIGFIPKVSFSIHFGRVLHFFALNMVRNPFENFMQMLDAILNMNYLQQLVLVDQDLRILSLKIFFHSSIL